MYTNEYLISKIIRIEEKIKAIEKQKGRFESDLKYYEGQLLFLKDLLGGV